MNRLLEIADTFHAHVKYYREQWGDDTQAGGYSEQCEATLRAADKVIEAARTNEWFAGTPGQAAAAKSLWEALAAYKELDQ